MNMKLNLVRVGVVLSLFGANAAWAVGTAAGTNIVNTATASFTDTSGTPKTVNSNTLTTPVAEILNVTIVSNDASNITVSAGQTDVPLSFKVTNTGNGSEPYALFPNNTVAGSGFNPTNTKVYIDTLGTGVFDPTHDTLYVPGSNDPVILADHSVNIFVVSDIPNTATNAQTGLVTLKTEAVMQQSSGSPQPAGYVYVGRGAGGTDAVIGSTTAVATAGDGFVVSAVLTSLVKSSSVLDQFGGSDPIPGAVITYSLTFTATGTGTITGTKVDDAIPALTTYVPGSITLDGSSLTDVPDADAGEFTSGTGIDVKLGSVTAAVGAPATHTVTFKVKIN